MFNAHLFLVLLVHFTLICVLRVIYICCSWKVDVLCNDEYLCLTQHSVTSQRQLQTGQGGSISTSETGQCYIPGLFPQRPCCETFISSALSSPAWAGNLAAAESESILLFPYIFCLLLQHSPGSCSVLGHHLVL